MNDSRTRSRCKLFDNAISSLYYVFQPIMAIFRPEPDAKRRWIFNLLHFTVGFLAQLSSGLELFVRLVEDTEALI